MCSDKCCIASAMYAKNWSDNFDTRIRWLVYYFCEKLNDLEKSILKYVANSPAWLSSKLYEN